MTMVMKMPPEELLEEVLGAVPVASEDVAFCYRRCSCHAFCVQVPFVAPCQIDDDRALQLRHTVLNRRPIMSFPTPLRKV